MAVRYDDLLANCRLEGTLSGDATLSGTLTLSGDNSFTGSNEFAEPPILGGAATALADADATLTVAQILAANSFTMTPTAARTLTLPTAALLAAGLTSVGDTVTFRVINLAAATHTVQVDAGSGGSANGTAGNRQAAAAGILRVSITMTNVTGASEAYVVSTEPAP